jgi:hypothetical protein
MLSALKKIADRQKNGASLICKAMFSLKAKEIDYGLLLSSKRFCKMRLSTDKKVHPRNSHRGMSHPLRNDQ